MFNLDLKKYTTLKGWEVPVDESTVAPPANGKIAWSNKDMDPVPEEKRVWTWFSFTTMWISDGFSPSTLQLAGSMIALGLSWKQALGAVTLGNVLIALACTANGYIGAYLHTPFSVNVRMSFGFWFAYFPIVTRLILALIYTGTKSYTSALATYQCIRAIWPSFANLENKLPASAGISSGVMIAYFIYFVVQTGFMMLSPAKLRWLFLAKSIIGPIAGFVCMGWYVSKSGGYLYGGAPTLTGSKLGWTFMSALNSAVGSYSTLSMNIGDFTRYARRPRDTFVQVVVIPFCFVFTAFMGIAIASGGYKVHNLAKIQFDPTRLMNSWSTDTSLERAALFFFGMSMALSNMGSNISANTLSAANDWCALMPKYINLRRGAILTAVLGCWATAPWKLLATAQSFLSLLGGYTLISAPIWAILVSDFFFVKRKAIDIPSMYDPNGRYLYGNRFGINWRVLATLLVVVPPELPGLLHAISSKIPLATGNANFYKIAWLFGTSSTLVLYPLLNKLFPSHETLVEEMIWTKDGAVPSQGQLEDEEKSLDKATDAETTIVPVV
ncbi:hypothetical protein JCM10207_002779 [Rhodosporidiobolus poonsookiae]